MITRTSRSPAPIHRPGREPAHRTGHQHRPRPARRPRVTPPPPSPLRRPDPSRERHRADQLPAARLRPEPDLAGHRHARQQPHGLAANAHPGRHRSPHLGAETPPAAPVFHRRTHRPPRPPSTPTIVRARTLGTPDHHRHRAAEPSTDLTPTPRPIPTSQSTTLGQWNPTQPAATRGHSATANTERKEKMIITGTVRPTQPTHVGSGAGAVAV